MLATIGISRNSLKYYLDVFLSLFWGECTGVTQKVNEADGNTTIHIEDELKQNTMNQPH